jgi:hypothetical protein
VEEKNMKAFVKAFKENWHGLEDFEKRATKNDWILEKIPYIDNGYFIDRVNRSIPL